MYMLEKIKEDKMKTEVKKKRKNVRKKFKRRFETDRCWPNTITTFLFTKYHIAYYPCCTGYGIDHMHEQ